MPVSKNYDLSSKEFFNNVHTTFSRMRKECPVYQDGSCFYITKYRECKKLLHSQYITKNAIEILSNEQELTQDITEEIKIILGTIILSDGVYHQKLRQCAKKYFSSCSLNEYSDFTIKTSSRLLDSIDSNYIDLIDKYIEPFILITIRKFLGIKDNNNFISFLHDFKELQKQIFPLVASEELFSFINTNSYSLSVINFFRNLCKDKTNRLDNGYVSSLLEMEESEELSKSDIVALSLITFAAFYESSMALIPNAILAFLSNLDQWNLLKTYPRFIDGAVEECMRYVTPVISGTERWAKQDITLGDYIIPKGSQVVLVLKSANRDEEIFKNPHKFDITRKLNHHLSFGGGAHFCLGNNISKVMLKTILKDLIVKLPNLSLSVDYESLEWKPSEFTLLKKLPVKLK